MRSFSSLKGRISYCLKQDLQDLHDLQDEEVVALNWNADVPVRIFCLGTQMFRLHIFLRSARPRGVTGSLVALDLRASLF